MHQLQSKVWSKSIKDAGMLRAARYGFMPNRLSLCGRERNRELLEYAQAGIADPGLQENLEDFETLYPHLKFIARSNRVKDPFDIRVVSAYWLGNDFLDNVSPNAFYRHFEDALQLKKKMSIRQRNLLYDKLPKGAFPHHAFHVLNVFRRTGHVAQPHTLETMNKCIISWGKVIKVGEDYLTVQNRPLNFEADNLVWGRMQNQEVQRSIDSKTFVKDLQIGDLVTFHWGFLCEKVSEYEVAYLNKYTSKAIELANLK